MSLIIARVFGNVNIINVTLSMKSMKLSKNKGYTIFVDAADFSFISLMGGDFSLTAMFFCRQVLAAVVY